MLVALLMLAPCTQAAPIDVGEPAPCTGILATTKQIKQALVDRAELVERQNRPCAPCPVCPACPKAKPSNRLQWALGGFVGGVLSTLSVLLVTR